MAAPDERLESARLGVCITPELALVDPALADHARSWLPQPDDTLERIVRIVRANRIAASRTRQMAALGVPHRGLSASDSELPMRGSLTTAHRRSVVLVGGVTAAAAVAALLVGVRIDLQGNPAVADTAPITEPAVDPSSSTVRSRPAPLSPTTAERRVRPGSETVRTRPPTRPTGRNVPSSPRRQNVAAPRRFVWAPSESASGYYVAFFRGSTLVFSAETARAEVSIPSSWTLAGRRRELEPGEYRWYVWPVVSGTRQSTAIVQAKLVVTMR